MLSLVQGPKKTNLSKLLRFSPDFDFVLNFVDSLVPRVLIASVGQKAVILRK